jgi:hypothetical protein
MPPNPIELTPARNGKSAGQSSAFFKTLIDVDWRSSSE